MRQHTSEKGSYKALLQKALRRVLKRVGFLGGSFFTCSWSFFAYSTILFRIFTRIKLAFFKLFRSLQLQFSGPTGINFRYSYSFVGLTGVCLYSYSSVQLHKKMVRGIIFRKLQLQLHKKMVFELKM